MMERQQTQEQEQFHTFFNTNLGTLFLGDSKEVLKTLPTASINAVITDPPWGVGYDEYDDFNRFIDIRDELYRVMKDNSWLLLYLSTKRIYDLLPYYEIGFQYKWLIPCIYIGFISRTRNTLGSQSAYTLVVVLAKGKPKLQSRRRDVIFVDELPFVEGKINEPQFKPTYTTAMLLYMFTRQSDVVLDPFAGYGSVPLVCEYFNRRWIGIEINKERFSIAKEIISNKKVTDIQRLKKSLSSTLL